MPHLGDKSMDSLSIILFDAGCEAEDTGGSDQGESGFNSQHQPSEKPLGSDEVLGLEI
jgi:hypothetical protein